MAYYFVYPFGTDADDLTSIPTTSAVDGSVSYQQGWTPPYEYDLATNPSALPIPRGQMNQLFFQTTQNIQQYQQYGTPNWITSVDNLGSPYAYPIYARVYYGGVVYENQVAGNTATPGTDSTWAIISGGGSGTIPGMIIDWAGASAPANWAICDGSALNRTTYASLLANITTTQTGTVTNGTPTVTGLLSTSTFRSGMAVEGTNIPAGTTILTVDSSTQITLSANATGGGSVSIKFFYWGNGNGTTTFNIPNLQDKTTAGAGGSALSFGSTVGASGGAATHTLSLSEIPQHTHNPLSPANNFLSNATPSNILYGGGSNANGTSSTTGGITSYTSQTALSLVQPTVLVNKIIRLV